MCVFTALTYWPYPNDAVHCITHLPYSNDTVCCVFRLFFMGLVFVVGSSVFLHVFGCFVPGKISSNDSMFRFVFTSFAYLTGRYEYMSRTVCICSLLNTCPRKFLYGQYMQVCISYFFWKAMPIFLLMCISPMVLCKGKRTYCNMHLPGLLHLFDQSLVTMACADVSVSLKLKTAQKSHTCTVSETCILQHNQSHDMTTATRHPTALRPLSRMLALT